MTSLSVNLNKIALLRNSRGRNFPNVADFAVNALKAGAAGITLHPRPDERHARYTDLYDLKPICESFSAELNVEGYPSEDFWKLYTNCAHINAHLYRTIPGKLPLTMAGICQDNLNF
jgi:pyridoxine 5-phosphate synthase